jgi:ubiquinone/menaquinone biosynthesis C-methylase UbiE
MSDQVRHPIFARVCERLSARAEEGEERDIRSELLAGLEGRVIEVGAGTGTNFELYPESVAEVVAVEPEEYLRARAQESATGPGPSIRVVDAVADHLPFADGDFDAAVACQVLCSVPSQRDALAELRRVVRPGGELRFYEHVLARDPRHARLQRLAGRVTPLLFGGCRPDRDTGATIESAGFMIERCRRFVYQPSVLDYPAAPRILGMARR